MTTYSRLQFWQKHLRSLSNADLCAVPVRGLKRDADPGRHMPRKVPWVLPDHPPFGKGRAPARRRASCEIFFEVQQQQRNF